MAEEPEYLSTDEFIAAMDAEDLEDAPKTSPRDYGKLRGIAPQLVYYHIRQGHIVKEKCLCGRSVIDKDAADEFFKKGKYAEG
jgi:RecA-family ATPase